MKARTPLRFAHLLLVSPEVSLVVGGAGSPCRGEGAHIGYRPTRPMLFGASVKRAPSVILVNESVSVVTVSVELYKHLKKMKKEGDNLALGS